MTATAFPTGSCTLVGAGPGDPELLTLKAVKAIQRATVLFVDDLVNEAVLAWAAPDARIVYVGKRGGCKSTPQAFIEKRMVTAVREGAHVVRLKGGDPFVFGRGGEEVEHLREAGIACEVVSGITSGLAASTALGVPLTHRDHARGVVFMTGHAKPGDDEADWRQVGHMARTLDLTLVVYMGVAHIAHIADGLLQSLPPDTPAALVRQASLPTEQRVITTLGQLAATAQREGLGSPSIILVGDVLHCAALEAPSHRSREATQRRG